jgi:predicted nucleic-acid-binding Zn-ribbon protein
VIAISSAAMADHTNADVQRLTDALNRVGVRLDCPSCGHVEWAPLGTTVVLPTSGVQPGFEAQGAECLALACKHCGFVRLHSAQVLEESD